MDVKNATPVTPDASTDYVLVHRRPADFDPLDPLKLGSIELVAISTIGGGSGSGNIDGGGPAGIYTTSIDGGTP